MMEVANKIDTLAVSVREVFVAHKLSLALAESCSGGAIAAAIVAVPGASGFFLGSIVSYSNAAKQSFLGLSEGDLHTNGAVSEETVRQMARGAKRGFDSDWSLAVSGISGPEGGQPGKPVGTVCFAWVGPGFEEASTRIFSGSRQDVIRKTVEHSLLRLLELIDHGK